MNYYDLIKLYRDGKLDDEQRDKVKNDIERQEAISEYLFEAEEIPGLEALKGNSGEKYNVNVEGETDKNSDDVNNFTKMIRSYIRRAFIKMGVIVGAVILAVTLFVIFGLPKVVDTFYYDPSKIAGTKDGFETNQLSLDWAVYSEMFLPGYYRDEVLVDGEGYGKYNINIRQSSTYTGFYNDVTGRIDKGTLILYNTSILKRPFMNAFLREIPGVEDYYEGRGAAGDVNQALAALEELSDDDCYMAYITLEQVMTYEQLVKWSADNKVTPMWCAICQKTDKGYFAKETIGFLYSSSSRQMHYNREKYPNLTQFDLACTTGPDQDWIVSEDAMKTHMISMLRYMDDQKDFRRMKGYVSEEGYLKTWAKNVEENGLNIYGFVVVGQKDEIIQLSQLEDVAYVYTSLLQ